MTWFGWLTKGAYEITVLDRITLVGEAVGLFMAFMAVYWVVWKIQQRNKK